MPAALEFAKFLCEISVDAVLVQDIGLFSLLRQCAPELPLHASTQMSLHTPDGVRLLYGLGAKRAVLARELSCRRFGRFPGAVPLSWKPLYMGPCACQCPGSAISAPCWGDAAGTGECAPSPRRLSGAPGGTGHDLSLKDLSFLREVEELRRAGVCSRQDRGTYEEAGIWRQRFQPAAWRQRAESPAGAAGQSGGGIFPLRLYPGLSHRKLGGSMFGIRRKEDVTGATERVFSALQQLYRESAAVCRLFWRCGRRRKR